MTMSSLLYRTLHPWEFTKETLHDNVELWDAKWKGDWEHYAATLSCECDLHEALYDPLAEVCMRRKHASDDKYHEFSIEEFQYLTQTLRKIEETGNVMLLQDDHDVIQRLKPDEQEMFVRVVQQLFPDQPEALRMIQNLS